VNIAQTIPLADSWGMHGGDIGAGWWIVMMGVMVLFWAAIILGIVWLVRGSAGGWPGWGRESPTEERRPETPTEILERRLAEGALSVEEYRTRWEVLVNRPDTDGAQKDELTAPPAGEGRK
jgi:putative membrane protein